MLCRSLLVKNWCSVEFPSESLSFDNLKTADDLSLPTRTFFPFKNWPCQRLDIVTL